MGKYNILLVDDQQPILDALERILGQDYNVFSATNGEDALSIMEREDIALIMTDHRMPGMNGSELLEHTMRKYPNTIRIIVSGYIDQKLLMDAINTAHVHGVVSKPWRNGEVKFIVRIWIEQYEKSRELEERAAESQELRRQLEEAQKASADADQQVQELTRRLEQTQKSLEYYQFPWYRRWFSIKPV